MGEDAIIIEAISTSPLNRGVDGSTWLASEGNIALVQGEDVTLFEAAGDGKFEAHYLYKSRGRAAINSAKEAFRRMFEDHGADLIFGLIPLTRPDVEMFTRWVGPKFAGYRNTAFGPCALYVLSKEMWSN